MTADQWLKIPLEALDTWTLAEIRAYVERKLDEHAKLRGQIARDLNRLGLRQTQSQVPRKPPRQPQEIGRA